MYPFDCISDLVFVNTELSKADVILIPGGSHPQLAEKAADLFNNGFATYILPSGGANPKIADYESEWEYIKQILIRLGVPKDRILKENQARHTFENAELSWEIIQACNKPISSAIIVCKAYHSRRALLTYQSVFPLDFTFYMSPVTDKNGITRDSWFLNEESIKKVMSEVEKIGSYFESRIPIWALNISIK